MKALLFCKYDVTLPLISADLCASLMLIARSVPGIQGVVLRR